MNLRRGIALLLTAAMLTVSAAAVTVTEVIPCVYDSEVLYQEGDFLQTVRDGQGVVCRLDGEPVMEAVGDQILKAGHILVQTDGRESVWNMDGEKLTGDYDLVADLDESAAICGSGSWVPPGRLEGKYGAVDLTTGETLVPQEYQELTFSADGSFLVGRNGEDYRIFDRTGADVTASAHAVPVRNMGDGWYEILDAAAGKRGVADENGQIAVPAVYRQIGVRVLSGVCLVAEESGKWGACSIDGSGAMIQPAVYRDAADYGNDMYALCRYGWVGDDNSTVELHYGDGAVAIPDGVCTAVEAVCGDVIFVRKPGVDGLYGISKTGQTLCSFAGGYVAFSDGRCDFVLLGKDRDVAEIAVVNRWGEILSPYTAGDSILSSGGSIGRGLELLNAVTGKSRFLMADGRGIADPDGVLMSNSGVILRRDAAQDTKYLTDLDGNDVIPAGTYRDIGTDNEGYYAGTMFLRPAGLTVRDTEGKYGVIRLDGGYVYAAHPWAQRELDAAIAAGIVPEDQQRDWRDGCTRGDFCRLVMAALDTVEENLYGPQDLTFVDTADPEILRAASLGIVGGVGGGRFAPNRPVTRQEAAVMLARAGKVLGLEADGEEKLFADAGDFALWAAEGVAYTTRLMGGGTPVMGGVAADRFSPLGTYTREQAVITMLRLTRAAGE